MDAIGKINQEMQKNPDDLYTEIIGHYVIDRCIDRVCEQLAAAEDKTLAGAMKAVEEAAKKKKSGNVAVLASREVFKAVDTYFGFSFDAAAQRQAMNTASDTGYIAPRKETKVLRLEDFL